MYNLTIYLKRDEEIVIRDFKELSYINVSDSRIKLTDDFSKLTIHDSRTYNFKGNKQVSVTGSEISYIVLNENPKN
ncbi:hypothetical protein [Lactococcus lactis]|uniref:hypothetical protein n=1 Tax=Lactococcus lactis TaxID=1358 RepID=UPI00071E429C|nr:hypothetical protein [Lactococcus lactis]KST88487.1 hypothetical protein LKF67_2300 [Lactococcus lactis subsp. lactis]